MAQVSNAALEAEISAQLGHVPAFFRVGGSGQVAEQLWSQAKSAYFESPIPPLFREELFTYLSRFCEVPYCMAHHAAFLQAAGREPAEVVQLLRQPIAGLEEVERELKTLARRVAPITTWPSDVRSPLGHALFVCSVHVFLRGDARKRCLAELARTLGPEKLEPLIALLGFARVAHTWTETQPELPFDREVESLIAQQPALRDWIAGYRSAIQAELGTHDGELRAPSGEHLALQQSAEQLGAILEGSLNEIYVFDAETLRFTQVNRGARQNLGYSMEELGGLTPLDLKPELTAQHWQELTAPLRSGEKARVSFETVHQRKDGTRYPVDVHLQLSAQGGRRAFVAIILDLSERRAQQEVIAEFEARAQAILTTAPDAIITINEVGVIEGANAATTRLFGYEAGELVGQNVQMLMPEPYAAEHDGYLESYRRTGEAQVIGKGREVEALRKDGRVFPIRLSIGETKFDHRRIFTGIITDLTAQRAAEAERDENDRWLRALFNQRTSLAGICSLEGVLLEANKASLDYVGATRDEVIGRPLWEAPWWSHDPSLVQQLRSGLEQAARGAFIRFDAIHPRADGSLGTVDFSITPVREPDGEIGILLVESIDITQQRNLQAQLFQSQKMEAIGTLAGGIAHDFNNLLTSIQGSSEILLDHLEPDGRLARAAARIQRATDRASALTTQLLGFSRKQVTQRKPLDLNETVREARDLFARTLSEDVRFQTELCQVPLYVRADESQLAQVLMNLVLNARDALAPGGELVVATARETVAAERARALAIASGDYASLVVRDTGAGMAPETLEQIFDPFFTTKEVGKGTGLGLSTALVIVREHEGAIAVESEPGVGTTFTVLLPEIGAPALQARAGAHKRPRPRASGETILLVEDDDIMRDLLGEVLEEEGYRVALAAQPDEALGYAREHGGEIDLVISDVVMPTMSGFELAQALRAHHPDLRVLYMSGYTDQMLADRGELRDDDPFIRKPFRNEALLGKVREVLAGPRR